MKEPAAQETSVSPFKAGLTCSCPRCGEGKLFSGYLTLAPRCPKCGLDYAFADSGDGPAIFVILFAGLVAMVAVLVVELAWRPAYWVHALTGIAAALIASLYPLRLVKSLLIALQYRYDAAEGRGRR